MADKTNDILLACSVGDVAWLRRGLQEGTDPYSTDREGLTGLHIAAKAGHYECLKHLLHHGGIDVNCAAKKYHLTPLHCSLLVRNKNSFRCVKFLLHQGAGVSSKDEHGSTPLHYAAKTGQIKCIELLLENGANVHDKDNDEKMAYETAQHHNQHQCFRFLSSVHWARKTDDVELKRLKEEEMAKQNRRDNEKLCLQLKKERGTKAFSKWLFDKSFCTSKTEPKECAKRKKIRLTPNSSSTCTYCSTVACSRGHSAQSGSMKIAPIKITSHQEGRNLDSIGRPVKMLPYTNYPPKKHHTAKRSKKCCASGSHSKKPSQKKINGKNVENTEGEVSVLKKLSATECLSTDLVQRQMTGWNDEDNKDMSVKSLKQLHKSNSNNSDEFDELSKSYLPKDTSNDGDDNEEEDDDDDYDDDGDDEDADEDEEEEEDDEDKDEDQEEEEDDEDEDDENKEDDSDDDVPIPFDDNDALPYPQLSFSVEDENNFFHEVGPMNDLNSLALPPVLTKGKTPAEVLQIIRHLEGSGSKATPRTRRSHSVSGYNSGRSRHFNRRLSLGSIPEGEILYNYNDDADNDKVDSQVLLDLENLIGSISGREEEENEHQENKERGDDHTMEKEERKENIVTVSLECELSTNMVHSEISCSPSLPPPSHKRIGSSMTPSSDDTEDSNPTTPYRRITTPYRRITPPSRKITPPSRKITPPSRASALFLSQASHSTQAHSQRLLSAPSTSQTSQRKRYTSSAPPVRKISPPRKNTPPSRKSSPPMLPNAEVTLLSSSIQEMQEDDSVSGNSEMHDRKAKTTGSNKCVVPMEQSAPSMKRRSAAPSLSLFAASGYSSPAQVSPSHSKSFSDPCMTYSPLNSPNASLQKASFFIGDSDSSSSYSSSSEDDADNKSQYTSFSSSMSPLASKSLVMSQCYSAPSFASPLASKSMVMTSDENSAAAVMNVDLSSSLPSSSPTDRKF